MRVASLEIVNFRGLRRLELDNLQHEALILVSGANGAGKSLILEAIYLAASRGFGLPPATNIGPWGNNARVRLRCWLSPSERTRLDELRRAHIPQLAGDAPEYLELGFQLNAAGNELFGQDQWTELLLNVSQRLGLMFGQVDYLPADRLIPRGEQANISTDVLSDQRRQELRQQAFQSAMSRNMLSLSGIQPVLATLDYLDLIQQRATGGTAGDDFDELTSAFERATGKRIPRPIPDPNGVSGARLEVNTQAGVSHGLDQLSSGEQSVLGLMFYARRLSSAGGVLLIDEPELHLHPALHSLLFAVLGEVADRAQIWTVSHSTRLVTAASAGALVHVIPAAAKDQNQAIRVAGDEDRLALLYDLGIDPAEALQADLLLIVEGDTDRKMLSRLLPVETGRAQFVIGRNAEGVMSTSRALAGGYSGAWIAIRDRDLLEDQERNVLLESDPMLLIWPSRTIESELLHPPLIARTFTTTGRSISVDDAEALLDELFDRQRAQIEAKLVEHLLWTEHSVDTGGGSSLAQLRDYLGAVRDVADAKLGRLDAAAGDVATRVGAASRPERLRLLDGKRGLGELVAASPFGTRSDLVDALVFNAREHADVRPPGLEQLSQRILAEAVRPV